MTWDTYNHAQRNHSHRATVGAETLGQNCRGRPGPTTRGWAAIPHTVDNHEIRRGFSGHRRVMT